MKYLFETTATLKDYNRYHSWAFDPFVKDKVIEADSLDSAMETFRKRIADDFIGISDNAMRKKSPMFDADENQEGFVVTGSYEFFDNGGKTHKEYIDLWICISGIVGFNALLRAF